MKRRHTFPTVAIYISVLFGLSGCSGCFGCGNSSSSGGCSSGSSGGGGGGCGGGFGSGFDFGRPDALPPYQPPPSNDASIQPTAIAKLGGQPHGLAAIGENVFVVDGETLRQIAFGPVPPPPIEDASTPDADADLDGSAEADVVIDAPMPTTPIVATNLGNVIGLVAYNNYLYWTVAPAGTTPGSIQRLRIFPTRDTIETVAETSAPVEGLVFDANGAMWLEEMVGLVGLESDGGVRIVAPAGVTLTGSFSQIARFENKTWFIVQNTLAQLEEDGGIQSTSALGALAVSANQSGVYVAFPGSLKLLDKGNFKTLAVLPGCRAMVASGSTIYVADDDRNVIRKFVNGSSSVMTTLATTPQDLAVTPTYVYFTTHWSGSTPAEVGRVAR